MKSTLRFLLAVLVLTIFVLVEELVRYWTGVKIDRPGWWQGLLYDFTRTMTAYWAITSFSKIAFDRKTPLYRTIPPVENERAEENWLAQANWMAEGF